MIQQYDPELKWVLLKFLRDSLEFLSKDSSLGVKRSAWAETWIVLNMSEPSKQMWMPKDEASDGNT